MTKRCWQQTTLGVAFIGGMLFFMAKVWVMHETMNNSVGDANIGAGILGLFGVGLAGAGVIAFVLVSIFKR